MSITSIVGVFLMVIGAIFGFAARHDYRRAGNQWTITARIRRRTAFIFMAIGAGLLLFALLSAK